LDLPADVWVQALINGFTLSFIYILMALGLAFIMSIARILQLAHGEVYMIGAYIVFYLTTAFGLNIYLALPLSMIIMAVFGIFMEKFIFRRIQNQLLTTIIASMGITMILTNIAIVSFGLYTRSVPRIAEGSFQVFGGSFPKDRVIVVAITVFLLLMVALFLKKFKSGQAMVAISQNREGAMLAGINPVQVSRLAFIIACALAAAGGGLTGAILNVSPFMGTPPLVKGIVIIVLGGLGSLPGAVVGGMILGLLDGILPIMFDPLVAALSPLILVVIFLLFRPQGLFGHE
jgi:branched-chain amino acid transport system permease protein